MNKALSVLAISLLFAACGQVPQTAPSVDQDSIVVKVAQPTATQCDSTRAVNGDGGHFRGAAMNAVNGDGGHRTLAAMNAMDKLCDSLVVQITGQGRGTDSVLVNVNGQEVTASVAADGHFEVTIPVQDAGQLDVSITPIE